MAKLLDIANVNMRVISPFGDKKNCPAVEVMCTISHYTFCYCSFCYKAVFHNPKICTVNMMLYA